MVTGAAGNEKKGELTVVSISPTSASALHAAGVRLGFAGVRGSTRGPHMPTMSLHNPGHVQKRFQKQLLCIPLVFGVSKA